MAQSRMVGLEQSSNDSGPLRMVLKVAGQRSYTPFISFLQNRRVQTIREIIGESGRVTQV